MIALALALIVAAAFAAFTLGVATVRTWNEHADAIVGED